MATSALPPLPSPTPEGRAIPELMSAQAGLNPGAAPPRPEDALQGYMRMMAESHMNVEEVARRFATRPDVTEAAQVALEAIRNLMQRITASADLGVGDESVPIGG